jgi:ribosome-binding factor A
MATIRQNKVSRLIQKDLGEIFQKEEKELLPGYMVTVTKVRITADLGIARVYLSIFPSGKHNEQIAMINDHKKHIRHELGKRIRHQVREIPELSFFIDDSLDYIERIENLLE